MKLINSDVTKRNNNFGNHNNVLRRKHFLFGLAIFGTIMLAYFALNSGKVLQEVEASDSVLIIGKYSGKPNHPDLPVQHMLSESLTVNTRVMGFLSKVDASFDSRNEFNTSQRFIIGSIEARQILQYIPFKYHDSETFPEYDAYSTDIEINGNYYGIILSIPK